MHSALPLVSKLTSNLVPGPTLAPVAMAPDSPQAAAWGAARLGRLLSTQLHAQQVSVVSQRESVFTSAARAGRSP